MSCSYTNCVTWDVDSSVLCLSNATRCEAALKKRRATAAAARADGAQYAICTSRAAYSGVSDAGRGDAAPRRVRRFRENQGVRARG